MFNHIIGLIKEDKISNNMIEENINIVGFTIKLDSGTYYIVSKMIEFAIQNIHTESIDIVSLSIETNIFDIYSSFKCCLFCIYGENHTWHR